MSLSTRRRLLTAWCAAAVLLMPAAPANATVVVVEAESGQVPNPGCGDDGPMQAYARDGASGGQAVFYPSSGCSQTFHAATSQSVISLRYLSGGLSAPICGHWEVAGALVGASPTTCLFPGTWHVAGVYSSVGVGDYTVTWVTDGVTPGWANGDLDFLKVDTSPSGDGPPLVERCGHGVIVRTPAGGARVCDPRGALDWRQ